jgi:hypothetical protein
LWLAKRINALVQPSDWPQLATLCFGPPPATMSQWPPNQVIVMLHAPRHQPAAWSGMKARWKPTSQHQKVALPQR